MSAEPVISCPYCLRQYAVDPSLGGRLAQCHSCKVCFSISLAEVAAGEPVVTLTEPLEPRYNFIREGCAELARNVADLLRMAGEPVTPRSVAEVVKSMPLLFTDIHDRAWKAGTCNRVMEEAFNRRGPDHEGRFKELAGYFCRYIPGRAFSARDALEGAFLGALSVEFEPLPAPQIDPPPQRRRGPLERLAERMGW